MIYVVPGTKMKKDLEEVNYLVASDEAEAVGLAVGEYLATGKKPEVWIGENGLLNALDALITLVNLYEVPLDLVVYLRQDEPQHSMVASKAKELCQLFDIKAKFK